MWNFKKETECENGGTQKEKNTTLQIYIIHGLAERRWAERAPIHVSGHPTQGSRGLPRERALAKTIFFRESRSENMAKRHTF